MAGGALSSPHKGLCSSWADRKHANTTSSYSVWHLRTNERNVSLREITACFHRANTRRTGSFPDRRQNSTLEPSLQPSEHLKSLSSQHVFHSRLTHSRHSLPPDLHHLTHLHVSLHFPVPPLRKPVHTSSCHFTAAPSASEHQHLKST